MKKTWRFAVVFCLFSGSFSSFAAGSFGSIVGRWVMYSDLDNKPAGVISVFRTQQQRYFGKVVDIVENKKRSRKDVCKLCKGKLKGKRIIGMTILRNLTRDGADVNSYRGGRILDPSTGDVYRCYVELQPGGKKLKVRGYIGISLLGRTQYWYREVKKPKVKKRT